MLRHPNIIEYHDSFLHERAMMIVMEYAAGGTLFDLLEKKAYDGKFLDEEEEIAYLFAQIILPMHLIHLNNILHRDIKSQNIFLTREKDFVKVRDLCF
jgi:serine/threonine protein kinase